MTSGNPLERDIEKAVARKALMLYGVHSSKLTSSANNGLPDRIFWVKGGKPLLIEFKRKGQVPRPNQQHVIEMLRKEGYAVEVHDNVTTALASIALHVGIGGDHD